jgi:hypothetical protein
MAMRALKEGAASKFQQILALKVIMVKFAGTWDMTFRPGGEEGSRASTFAQGKQFVGQRIAESFERPMKMKKEGVSNDGQSIRPERKNPKPESERARPDKPEAG